MRSLNHVITEEKRSSIPIKRKDALFAYIRGNTISLTGIIIEGVLLFLIITALFAAVLHSDGWYLRMNIHPLLVITCILGMRHGLIAGIIASLAASLHYYLCYVYLGHDPLLFFISFEYYKFPLMFVMGGYVTGRVRNAHKKQTRDLRYANSEIVKAYDELTETHEKTTQLLDELREQIIGAEYSIFSLYEVAQSLQTYNPERIYTESIGLLHKLIKANGISIYMLGSNGYMRLKMCYGPKSCLKRSKNYQKNETYKKVLQLKKAVRWQGDLHAHTPIFSAPIVHMDTVIGIIDIDSIGFEYVTEYSFGVFQLMSDWISQALFHAIKIDAKLHPKESDGAVLLALPRYMEQLEEERYRMEKYDLPFSEIVYSTNGHDAEALTEGFRKTLRNVDYLCCVPDEQIIRILLPATHETDFLNVERRLFSQLNVSLTRVR